MPSIHIDPTYHPTTRERLFQGMVASQRDADRIRRRRRMRRRQWRRERLYPVLLGVAIVAVVIIGLIDWEGLL